MNKKDNETEDRPSKKVTKLNEDIAMEIINIEFKDLEDWLKKEMKTLKGESFDIIDSLKLKNDD
jgi:hypothetical protein